MKKSLEGFTHLRMLAIMNRISGILFREPASQLQAFMTLKAKLGSTFRKVSPTVNIYFHADGRSQYTTVRQTDGTLKTGRHIIWVGTIHNRNEVIRFLSQSGIAGGTDMCDAQLTLHLYNLVEHDVSTHLIGYYAFAVWDEATQSLFLSRDAIGAERLYYFYKSNVFCWGTEIRQVCCLSGIKTDLNEEWMAEALTWSWDGCLAHTKDSPIKGVQSVPPGHSLRLNLGEPPKLTQWWEWGKDSGKETLKDDDLIEKFRELLTGSVKGCLDVDSPVIADLSGGLDSSSVVSLACHLAEKGDTSIHLKDVISFQDPSEPRFDDTEYQESVVKRYGLNWHKFSFDRSWYLQGIRDQNTYFDYPNPMLLWLNLAREPVKYASERGFAISLTGCGGDKILVALPLYIFDCVRSGKFRTAWREITTRSTLNSRPLWKIISDNILLPIKHRHHLWEPQIPQWLNNDFLLQTNLEARFKELHRDLQGFPLSTQLNTIAIRYSSDRPFTYGKYITEPLGIHTYHPFLDRRLINFAIQLPHHLKQPPKQSKYILRQAMEGILPDTVRLRTGGAAFSHFRRRGLTNEADAFADMRSNPIIAQRGFVNLKRWEEALTRYKLGSVDDWNVLHPTPYMDSPLSVEVWLRTCLPLFHEAYRK
ncbi:MAG: asparagine synthase-related protein [Gammaproteobacteria bacterium]|nr:asparagine synthase-related protein [Gammaproteobacteria bacterium]